MNNKKNIDRLFQEKFKDFEVAPNDAVWDRINESLPNKKKKRRVIALWWQIGGVAAVIALLLTVGVSVFKGDDNNNLNLPVVNTDKNDTENKKNKDALNTSKDKLKDSNENKLEFVDSDSQDPSHLEHQKRNTPKKKTNSNLLTTPIKSPINKVTNNSNEKKDVSTSQKPNKLNTITRKDNSTRVVVNTKISNMPSEQSKETKLVSESELKSGIETTIEDNRAATVDNSNSNKTESSKIKNTAVINTDESDLDSVITEDPKKESIQDAIAEQIEAIDEKEKEDEQNRWSIAPNVAPVYYGSLGQGSSLDQQFNENAKRGDINMSYGITGAYAVSKKLKIRAGINRLNLSQITSDVFTFTVAESFARGTNLLDENISFKNGGQTVSLMSSKILDRASAPEIFNTKTAGDIDQRFGFIEVPLELEYRVLDKTFGINVIGGFSTFFLNENEIYVDIEGASTLIGEANNINSTSFSANFGLGLDYSLSKQWNINLEPQFKYQINTFNNTTGDFRPFFIGVYTGLSFKF